MDDDPGSGNGAVSRVGTDGGRERKHALDFVQNALDLLRVEDIKLDHRRWVDAGERGADDVPTFALEGLADLAAEQTGSFVAI